MERYEDKFAPLIKLCKATKPGDIVCIATPESLGDTYEELIESLNRLADAGARIDIVPRKDRERATADFRSN